MHSTQRENSIRPSETHEAIRERNQRRTRDNSKRGSIDYAAPTAVAKADLQTAFASIRELLGGRQHKFSNYDVLVEVTNFFLMRNGPASGSDPVRNPEDDGHCFEATDKNKTEDRMFLCTSSSVNNLVARIEEHRRCCGANLKCERTNLIGHAGRLHFVCNSNDAKHRWTWYSSSTLPNGKLLVNYRMLHAVETSGMLYAQYDALCKAGNMGVLGKQYRKTFISQYGPIVERSAEESRSDALLEEIAFYGPERRGGIEVMSDARHATRKNAKQSDIVFLGDRTHKCVYKTCVTREDDTCSQRHEMAGVRRFYEWADENAVPVDIHAHDRNASVNKFIREERPETQNSNDTWHVTKQVGREVKKITSGAQRNHGKTWHADLSDKGASIKTHFYWCMKHAKTYMRETGHDTNTREEACQILRQRLDNIVNHYQGNHGECHPTSGCRSGSYEPTWRLIRSPVAVRLLSNFIRSSVVYKQPEHFIDCKDTHYVESYNNVVLVYTDKRVVLGNYTYKLRSDMACLDWNENVDRPATSTVAPEPDHRRPRRQSGYRNTVRKTSQWKNRIWREMMTSIFTID
ncbi:uncharacterized protein [Ptychodera flava]|uniref:uncharacterized protein n=1 Tax=Ptychodera flava TaxID=63121 RepID=UPI003969C296